MAEGGEVTYTAVVRNHGPGTATGVVSTHTLGGGATLVSVVASQGACAGTGPVVCSLGRLAIGESATITLVARAGSAGPVTHHVGVGARQGDPNVGDNNYARMATDVQAPALAEVRLSVVRVTRHRTWLRADVDPQQAPARMQLALDPDQPWAWRSFVTSFSFRPTRTAVWVRFAAADGRLSDWQQVTVPAASRR